MEIRRALGLAIISFPAAGSLDRPDLGDCRAVLGSVIKVDLLVLGEWAVLGVLLCVKGMGLGALLGLLLAQDRVGWFDSHSKLLDSLELTDDRLLPRSRVGNS